MKLRALSYNVHKGRAFVSRRRTWDGLLKLVMDTEPDVIFLQEFLHEREALGLLEGLADHLWPHHSFGQNATWNGNHYGNAILSRYPLAETHNTDISTSPFERRGLLYGLVEPRPGRKLHLFCCHLDLTHRGRRLQLQKLRANVEKLTAQSSSLLIAGDFNDWHEKLHGPLAKSLHVAEAFETLNGALMPSSPSIYPIFSLDRIYYRRLKPVAGECHVKDPWQHRSDHLPMTVDFLL